MVNGFLKSGVTSTGAVARLVFKSSNALTILTIQISLCGLSSNNRESVPLSVRSFG